MGINIRQKGATAERELATELNTQINVVRMQLGLAVLTEPVVQRNQNQSAVGGCDLVGTFGYAIEVKRQEQLSIGTWWAQCVKSAEFLDEAPVLIFRQSKQKWRVILFTQVPIAGTSRFAKVRSEIQFDDFLHMFRESVRATYEKDAQPTVPGEQLLFVS